MLQTSSSWDTAIGQGGKLKADYDDVMSATRGIQDEIGFDYRSRSTYGKAKGAAKRRATTYRTDMKYIKRRANSNKSK